MSNRTVITRALVGVVQQFNNKRGFGFITEDLTENKIFFHKTEVLYDDIEAGDEVQFDLYLGPKGYFAESVEFLNTEPGYTDSEPESEAENHLIEESVTGVVQTFNEKRGFGFIVNGTYDKVFFHKTEVSYQDIEAGDKVTFDLNHGPKGYFADSVEFVEQYSDSESEPESEAENHLIEENVTGVVQNYNEKRGYGFIRVNDTYDKVFFHKTEVSYQDIEAGDQVTFDFNHGPKGYFADSVEIVEQYSDSESDSESEDNEDPEVNLGTNVTGVVKRYFHNRKFGFITVNDTYKKVFFHISDVLYEPVEVGDKVRFDFYQGPKGYFAESVGLVVDPSDDWEDEDIQSTNEPTRQDAHCRGLDQRDSTNDLGKTSSESSRTFREKGNVFFKSASDQKSDDAKENGFTSAREWYKNAFTSSQKDGDLASAAKNFGTASWKLAKLKMDRGSTDNKMIHSYLKDALQYFSKAYAKRASMVADWSQHLETSIKKCLDDIRSWIASKDDDDRIAVLKEFVGYMPECPAKVSCHLNIATIIFRKGKDAMKLHEYKKCERFLDECAIPLAEAKRSEAAAPNLGVNIIDLQKDIEELRDMVIKCLSKAQDEQARQAQEQKDAEEKSTAMKQLKSDLKKLERFKKLAIEDFVKQVYNRWPPKGAHGWKPTCVPASSSSSPSSSPRKLLIRAISKYHPDKVDKNAHGLKWYLMSGEITKCFNQRLANVKN